MTLHELAALQLAFDTSRGFANLPFAQDLVAGGDEERLGKLEFALMGLAGEVGEIAGILKRTRRRLVQSGSLESGVPAGFDAELADVLAYILKLVVASGVDLEAAYLSKMAINAHRFKRNQVAQGTTLSLCGPPGSGKTSVALALAADRTASTAVYLERFEQNPHLGDIQETAGVFDADQSQRWFLSSMTRFLASQPARDIVLDQDPTAIVAVYSALLRDQGRLAQAAMTAHLAQLVTLETDYALMLAGRRVVFLDAPAPVLARRCAGKFGEPADESFTEELRGRFAAVYDTLPNVVRVDASVPLEDVVAEVRSMLVR